MIFYAQKSQSISRIPFKRQQNSRQQDVKDPPTGAPRQGGRPSISKFCIL